MKQIFTTLCLLIYLSTNIFAQHCSSANNSITPVAGTVAGFSPSDTLQPCAVIGNYVSDTIYFHNYDSVRVTGSVGAHPDVINTLTIDSIYLPAGLCWETNVSTNQFGPGADGVILISGTPTGPPGQYKLRIIATITASSGLVVLLLPNKNMETLFNLRYDLRVTCPSSPCPSVNTTDTTDSYIAYAACSSVVATITPSGSVSYCPDDSVMLSAYVGVGYTYLWSNGDTSQSIWVHSPASYTLTVYNGTDSAVSSPTIVTQASLPDTALTLSGPASFCTGDSVTISAASGLTYHWNTGATTSSVTAKMTGNYSVTVTNSSQCTAASQSILVSLHSLPDTALTLSGPTSFCQGGSLTITAASGLSYHWSTNATTPSISASSTGNYAVTVTNATPCTAVSRTVAVMVNALPDTALTISGSTTFCTGDSVTITAASGLTYLWSTGATTSSITVDTTGSYSVTVTNSTPCSASSGSISVTDNTPPTAVITQTGADTLTSSTGPSYQWYRNDSILPGDTMQQLIANASGVYKVILGANGCSSTSNQITISLPNGINTLTLSMGIRLYPNPGEGLFTLEVNGNTGGSYVIHDQVGRLIQSGNVSMDHTAIDVSDQPSGIYYLSLRTEDQNGTLRFVIIK